MTRFPDPDLPPQSQQWGRSVEDRLRELERREQLTAQDTNNTLTQLNSSIQSLVERSVRAQAFVGNITQNVPTGDTSVVSWSASTNPQLTLIPAFGLALVVVGATVNAEGINTSDGVYAHLGLSVNGATPNTNRELWPAVFSQNPVSGSNFTQPITYSQVVNFNVGQSNTLNPRYGYTRFGSVSGATTNTYTNPYIIVTPIPGT